MLLKPYLMGQTENKNFNSAVICAMAVVAVVILDRLFPALFPADMKTAIVTAIAAFLYNLVREATK